MRTNKILICLAVVIAAAALIAPFFHAPQINNWIFRIATLVMLATSWNMMANAGLISLGHSAFWGVGSYVGVMSANALGLPFPLALLAAMIAGAVMGAVLAQITGNLKGIFFAISTLALSEGLRITALMTPGFTGGAMGLFLRNELRPSALHLYLAATLAAIGCVIVAVIFSRSKLYFASRTMRENEGAAQMLGVNPRRQRMIVVAISGAMATLAGGISSWYGGYLDPDVAFTLHNTILAQIAPIIGGVHTIAGPVIGSMVIIALSEATRYYLGDVEGVSQLTFGLILVLCILFMPRGVWSLFTGGRTGGPFAGSRKSRATS